MNGLSPSLQEGYDIGYYFGALGLFKLVGLFPLSLSRFATIDLFLLVDHGGWLATELDIEVLRSLMPRSASINLENDEKDKFSRNIPPTCPGDKH